MTFFDLVLQTSGSLHPAGEPSDYISTFTGVIHAEVADADGEPLFDVCDSYSAELHEVHTLLYEPDTYHYRADVPDHFDEAGADTLLIDYVILHPKWRGLRLGLLAVRKLIDLIGGGCGLAVSDIAPLRPNASKWLKVPKPWVPRHETADARKEAVRKLRRYYRQMGFTRIGRTRYYALPLARLVPTLSDLLRGEPRSPDRDRG
jgi:hypothetical protein